MKISIFIKLESQIVTCLEVPISQAYPISCAIARNCFGSLLGGNKLDFPHLMQPRDPRMNHNAYFFLLTLFTIAYFTDDSPSHGVVITPPQGKLPLKIFLHQNFSLGGLRVSIADFGFEGPGFESQLNQHFH